MEKLTRRSDGAYETPSGLFAISPRAVSGKKDGVAWFEFKATVLSEIVRVEWPETAPVIVIDQGTARTMLLNGYAFGITDDQMNDYNAAVDAYNEANGDETAAAEKKAAEEKAAAAAKAIADAAEADAKTKADDAAKAGAAASTPPPPPPPPAPAAGEPAAAETPEAKSAKGKGK